MFLFVSDLYAMMPKGGEGGGMYGQFALFGAIFLIFFLLVIRPQQKKAKMHREMITALQKGDQIITTTGIYGKINKYFDDKDYMLLEIADKIVIKMQKGQVATVIKSKGKPQISDDTKGKAKEKNGGSAKG